MRIKKLKGLRASKELAEILGIISGDGHLSRHSSCKRSNYKVSVFGHKEDDKDYFNYV